MHACKNTRALTHRVVLSPLPLPPPPAARRVLVRAICPVCGRWVGREEKIPRTDRQVGDVCGCGR